MSAQRKTAMLLGAYGQTNLGDDLLLYNYLNYITELGFTDIYVNASEAKYLPVAVLEKFPNLHVFETYHTSFMHMLGYMRRADAIFYGGGTVYKELYSSTGRSPYTVIVRVMLFNMLAKLLGKQIFGLHIGIGTLKTPLGRWITKKALQNSTHTTFRDEQSFVCARDTLKVAEHLISQSTDGLFLDPAWQQPWLQAKIPAAAKQAPHVVGVNVLSDIPDWVDRTAYLTTMRTFVRDLLARGDFVVFLPFQTDFNPHNDLAFIKKEIVPHIRQFKNYAVADDVDISNVVSYLQQMDVLVGMRFHSLLLATVAGTPFLAVAYDTKCWRFIEEINYSYAQKIEDVSTERLHTMYKQLLAHTGPVKKQLARAAEVNFKAATLWKQQQKW